MQNRRVFTALGLSLLALLAVAILHSVRSDITKQSAYRSTGAREVAPPPSAPSTPPSEVVIETVPEPSSSVAPTEPERPRPETVTVAPAPSAVVGRRGSNYRDARKPPVVARSTQPARGTQAAPRQQPRRPGLALQATPAPVVVQPAPVEQQPMPHQAVAPPMAEQPSAPRTAEPPPASPQPARKEEPQRAVTERPSVTPQPMREKVAPRAAEQPSISPQPVRKEEPQRTVAGPPAATPQSVRQEEVQPAIVRQAPAPQAVAKQQAPRRDVVKVTPVPPTRVGLRSSKQGKLEPASVAAQPVSPARGQVAFAKQQGRPRQVRLPAVKSRSVGLRSTKQQAPR